jgi:DNA-binding response OmpR family regulator/anti-sigma regulatory factor (Ser/Thr protein kinase)
VIVLYSPASKELNGQTDRPLVLIADDDPLSLELLEAILQSAHFQVVKASNGREVMEKLDHLRPQLLLLDVMMPHLTGFEVCRSIKQDPDRLFLPVILVTGLSESEHKVHALNVGADDLLNKPYCAVELIARVRSLLRMRHLIENKLKEDHERSLLEGELALERLRRDEESRRKSFYKEVIYAVSGGKLVLTEPTELTALLEKIQFTERISILGPENVRDARRLAERFLLRAGASQEVTSDLVLCASEAATNVLKHAGSGTMHVGFCRIPSDAPNANGGVRATMFFEDQGPGIAPDTLPRATLQKGFSTLGKLSLGVGFSILLELVDRISLCPGPPGTQVVLEKDLHSKPRDGLAAYEAMGNWVCEYEESPVER